MLFIQEFNRIETGVDFVVIYDRIKKPRESIFRDLITDIDAGYDTQFIKQKILTGQYNQHLI